MFILSKTFKFFLLFMSVCLCVCFLSICINVVISHSPALIQNMRSYIKYKTISNATNQNVNLLVVETVRSDKYFNETVDRNGSYNLRTYFVQCQCFLKNTVFYVPYLQNN